MRDRELILRFFALHFAGDSYSKPMKEFLTQFLTKYRNIVAPDAKRFSNVFRKTCEVCNSAIGPKSFKPKRAVNAALCDAVMVGIADRLKAGDITEPQKLKMQYDALLKNEAFYKTISSATTNDSNVSERLRLSKECFSTCP